MLRGPAHATEERPGRTGHSERAALAFLPSLGDQEHRRELEWHSLTVGSAASEASPLQPGLGLGTPRTPGADHEGGCHRRRIRPTGSSCSDVVESRPLGERPRVRERLVTTTSEAQSSR